MYINTFIYIYIQYIFVRAAICILCVLLYIYISPGSSGDHKTSEYTNNVQKYF